jgi:hypothetical protein
LTGLCGAHQFNLQSGIRGRDLGQHLGHLAGLALGLTAPTRGNIGTRQPWYRRPNHRVHPRGWGHSVVALAAFMGVTQGLNALLQIGQIAQFLLAGFILGG